MRFNRLRSSHDRGTGTNFDENMACKHSPSDTFKLNVPHPKSFRLIFLFPQGKLSKIQKYKFLFSAYIQRG